MQKVSRHRKQAGQLWLSGSCLVLHIITIWNFYLTKSLMFLSDDIFSIENPWPIWQYTNIAKVHGSRNQNTRDKLYCACLMDSFSIPLAREWWVTLWRGVSRSHSARGTLAAMWGMIPPAAWRDHWRASFSLLWRTNPFSWLVRLITVGTDSPFSSHRPQAGIRNRPSQKKHWRERDECVRKNCSLLRTREESGWKWYSGY